MHPLYKKELFGHFKGPMGYIFLIIFLIGIGQLTFELGKGSFFALRQADLRSFFQYIPWMFVFLIPAITMKMWSEERKAGTLELLFSMPLSVKKAVIIKFFANLTLVGFALLCTLPMVFTVFYLGNPDIGVIFTGYLASFFLGALFVSMGTFFSIISNSQVVSFILTVTFCLIFLLAGSPPILNILNEIMPAYVVQVFESLSILNHFDSMERGLIRFSDIWFFAILIGLFLYASVEELSKNKAVK